MYILQLGFLDGYEGYLLAKYSSIYTMTKYTKLREEYYNNLGNDTSLVITTYNWPKALEICLNSALNQTVPPKEIIVADDGSKQELARRHLNAVILLEKAVSAKEKEHGHTVMTEERQHVHGQLRIGMHQGMVHARYVFGVKGVLVLLNYRAKPMAIVVQEYAYDG